MKRGNGIRIISMVLTLELLVSTWNQPVFAQPYGENIKLEYLQEDAESSVSDNSEEVSAGGLQKEEENIEDTQAEEESTMGAQTEEFTDSTEREDINTENSVSANTAMEEAAEINDIKLIKEENYQGNVTKSTTAVVTDADEFRNALANENISLIEISGTINSLQGTAENPKSEGPMIINRPLTIQGGTLNMRYLGIILGADAVFKDITLEFSTTLLDIIAANGYQLTLDNVTVDSTAGDDCTISVFCGGIQGYELSQSIPSTGSNGTVIIRGNSTVGNIYAGSLSHVSTESSVFDGNAKVIIEEGTTGSLGKIYGCGGRESIDESTGNLIYVGEDYYVTGDISITLYDSLVKEVIGYNGKTAVNFQGSGYQANIILSNITSLGVESGELCPENASGFDTMNPDISVASGGRLSLENYGDMSINNFSGGGELIVGQEQKLTIEGNVSGSTKVYIGGAKYSEDGFGSLSQPVEEHTYMEARHAEENNFVFADWEDSPEFTPVFQNDGNGGGSWSAPKEIIEIISITFEEEGYEFDKETFESEQIEIPLWAEYTEDTSWTVLLDILELEVKINNKEAEVEKDEDGYVYYRTDEVYCYIFTGDDCSMIVQNGTEDGIPEPGIYKISITVPAKYTENQMQELTAEVTLEITGEVIEEEKTPIEKPVAFTGLMWNGSEQIGVSENTGYTLTGDYKATEIGTYTAKAVLNEGYVWSDDSADEVELQWSIEKAEIEIAGITIEPKVYDATTEAAVTKVSFQGLQMEEQLERNVDYTVNALFANAEAGDENTVTAVVMLKNTEKANHYVLKETVFELTGQRILPKEISDAKVLLTENRFEYSGSKVELGEQDITVILGEKELQNETDYEILWPEDMIEVGTKTIKIQGKGNYTGIVEVTFEIYEMQNVPEGLWIAGINENGYEYTGKAIKPEIRVYYGGVLLREKSDYKISYKNNINANAETEGNKAPAVIITGIGNYSGKKEEVFKILQKDITENTESGSGIMAEDIIVNYNSKIQKAIPAVYDHGNKLKSNVHYTLEYPSTSNVGEAYKDIGNYEILIIGKGNYTGERRISLKITAQELLSKAVVSRIPNMPYDEGKSVEPEITVKYGGADLAKEDYTVRYENNRQVGIATVIIEAKEGSNYIGEKRVTFKITGTSISKAVVEGMPKSLTYTGKEITAEKLILKMNGTKLEAVDEYGNGDYSVEYLKNTDKGTATIIFTGKNGYTGTLKKTFAVKAYDIKEEGVAEEKKLITVTMDEKVPYEKGGSRPKPVVKFDGKELKEGKDYTLSYRNNTAVTVGKTSAKTPMVIVKGKGNFTGSIQKKFGIEPKNFEESNVKMELSDKAYRNRKNAYKVTPKVIDENGKVLRAGSDYTNITYLHAETTILANGDKREEWKPIENGSIVLPETQIKVEVTGTGKNYQGTLTGYYRITEYDFGKAKVTIPTQFYSGKEVLLSKDDIVVKFGGKRLENEQFEIVGYKNNRKKGTATVYIKGCGVYGGMKEVKFRIKTKVF